MWQPRLLTIGLPSPYSVRVFGTMNGPGSLANYLVAGILVLLPLAGPWRYPGLALGIVALVLTLVRTSWLALLVGLVVLLIADRTMRSRATVVAALCCIPLLAPPLLAVVPEAGRLVSSRFETLTSVDQDESFMERNNSYRTFLVEQLPDNLLGSGLGASGAYQSYLDKSNTNYVDGALLDIGNAFGLLGIFYIVGVVLLGSASIRHGLAGADPFVLSCAAIVLSDLLAMVGGITSIGEMGFLFWIAIGFSLRPAVSDRLATA